MKKLLLLFAISLIFFACNDKKKGTGDEKASALLGPKKIPIKSCENERRFKCVG